MAIEVITMPQLGEGITEAEITMWLKKEGEEIEAYEPLLEILTDKVTTEVPVTVDGTITKLLYAEGDVVQMGAPIAEINTGGAEEVAAPQETVVEEKVEDITKEVREFKAPKQERGKARYSPAVVKLSAEHGIDLSLVEGTGKGGRITRKDIYRIIEDPSLIAKAPAQEVVTAPCDDCMSAQVANVTPVQQQVVQPVVEKVVEVPVQPAKETSAPKPIKLGARDIEIPVSPIRKAIAKNIDRKSVV